MLLIKQLISSHAKASNGSADVLTMEDMLALVRGHMLSLDGGDADSADDSSPRSKLTRRLTPTLAAHPTGSTSKGQSKVVEGFNTLTPTAADSVVVMEMSPTGTGSGSGNVEDTEPAFMTPLSGPDGVSYFTARRIHGSRSSLTKDSDDMFIQQSLSLDTTSPMTGASPPPPPTLPSDCDSSLSPPPPPHVPEPTPTVITEGKSRLISTLSQHDNLEENEHYCINITVVYYITNAQSGKREVTRIEDRDWIEFFTNDDSNPNPIPYYYCPSLQ